MIMKYDLLSDVLSAIKNGDNAGKSFTIVPASNLVKNVLLILQKHKYIGDFEYIDDNRGREIFPLSVQVKVLSLAIRHKLELDLIARN